MAKNNVTPITAAGKPEKETADRIEEQRGRIRAMNLVQTTALSMNEDEMDQKGTLETAYELLNDIALELNVISGQ
jgi:hypothetical protein